MLRSRTTCLRDATTSTHQYSVNPGGRLVAKCHPCNYHCQCVGGQRDVDAERRGWAWAQRFHSSASLGAAPPPDILRHQELRNLPEKSNGFSSLAQASFISSIYSTARR